MKNLRYQVYRFTDGAKSIPQRLNPKLEDRKLELPDVEQTFEELLERIQKTIDFVETFKKSDFEGIEADTVVTVGFGGGRGVRMRVDEFLAGFSHPNFW